MAIQITPGIVVAGLRDLVVLKGEDYVYEPDGRDRCDYVRSGEPSCIVGRFLANLGVPLERLEKADATYGGISVGTLLEQLEEEGVIDRVSFRATQVLSKVQHRQDSGIPWGVAVQEALEEI